MANVILYTGLATTNAIRKKLESKGIPFTEKSASRPQMTFTREPVMSVNGRAMDHMTAIEWIHNK